MDTFVNTHFKGEIADCYNKLNIIVAKTDFWRYLVLYKYGGIYMDFDTKIKYSLDKILKEHDNDAIIFKENATADFFNIHKNKTLMNPFYNSKFNKCFF